MLRLVFLARNEPTWIYILTTRGVEVGVDELIIEWNEIYFYIYPKSILCNPEQSRACSNAVDFYKPRSHPHQHPFSGPSIIRTPAHPPDGIEPG